MNAARMAVVCLLALVGVAASEVKVPPIWPQIQGLFPRGGQRGTEVAVTIKGRNLQGTTGLEFASSKLNGRVVSATAYEVKAVVRLAADAEPGRHDMRLVAGHGTAIGYFDVGTLTERTEKEPNNDVAKAEVLAFPALVNGILTAGDYDHYMFEAKAGDVLTFDIQATRLGAQTDAVLSLLDDRGEEIAYSDDYYGFKDPRLQVKFDKSGRYTLRVYGSGEAGCETCDYRLTAGAMPDAELAMPAGVTAGKTVSFTLRGVNLAGVKRVTLGDGLAEGVVTSAKFSEATVRMAVPAGVKPGDYKLHVEGSALPVPFVVGRFSEVTVADGSARSRKDPVPVTLPVVANGVIDQPHAADYFVFRADGPKTVVLETEAMQLGYLTDPLVAIYDESGKRLAYQDDPTTNTGKEPANMDPHLVFTLPKAGRYIAMVRDAQFRGGPAFLYRLTMKDAEPDFAIRVVGTDDTLYRGRPNRVLVRVRRLEGWDAPVEVMAENLPAGVRVKPVVAEPKNTPYTGTCGETHYLDGTNVEMVFEVDSDAPLALGQIRFRGKGVFQGRAVERWGKTRYFRTRIRHIGDAEEEALRVTVADAPGVVLAVPQNLTLAKDGAARFTAIVTRLDEGSTAPLELTLEAAGEGLSMEPLEVPVSATRADVKLKGGTKAVGEFVLVGRVDGRVVGKSHPITVRSKS
ncbi:MAG: pre-peptidase C-terminal domain-containing protein [Acidobacteriota bacterium]